MYTITVTYKDETKIYYEVQNWETIGRIFSIKLKGDNYIFLPICHTLEIEVTRNN